MGARPGILVLGFAALLAAQGTPLPQSEKSKVEADSARDASVVETMAKGVPDSASRPIRRADTVLVVKHQFRHREQIIAGSSIMACLAGIMVIMNNYNPR
jgi:hypothetical protein